MWQSLHDELKDLGFTVLAIAMDGPEAARPWIEAAAPAYPCLVDHDHHVADLYGLVNVPQAVWIDESGRIVRGPETAGATDGFRRMDRQRFTMPEEAIEERRRVKERYLDAIRDWARKGTQSGHLPDTATLAARLKPVDPAIAEAHARFRLGRHLARRGREQEAQAQFALAVRLHPDSWNIWRQTAGKDERGLASGEAFWARVDALGDRPYYAPVDTGEARGRR